MFQKENRIKLIILIVLVVLASGLYSFDLREMFKVIVTWGIGLLGYDLLFEDGLMKRVEKLAEEINKRRDDENEF